MMGVPGTPKEAEHRALGWKAAGEQAGELGFILRHWGAMEVLERSLRLPDWGRIPGDRSEA